VQNLVERKPSGQRPVLVSAVTGEGAEQLIAAIERRLGQRRVVLDLVLDPADGAGVSWLHRHTEVMEKSLSDDGKLAMTVRVDPGKAGVVRTKFPALAHH
jgi:GTP-binding protein HflX